MDSTNSASSSFDSAKVEVYVEDADAKPITCGRFGVPFDGSNDSAAYLVALDYMMRDEKVQALMSEYQGTGKAMGFEIHHKHSGPRYIFTLEIAND